MKKIIVLVFCLSLTLSACSLNKDYITYYEKEDSYEKLVVGPYTGEIENFESGNISFYYPSNRKQFHLTEIDSRKLGDFDVRFYKPQTILGIDMFLLSSIIYTGIQNFDTVPPHLLKQKMLEIGTGLDIYYESELSGKVVDVNMVGRSLFLIGGYPRIKTDYDGFNTFFEKKTFFTNFFTIKNGKKWDMTIITTDTKSSIEKNIFIMSLKIR